ncbi:MAG: histidine kinase [Draconibacterium sp.]|nr:histidine kinase [Draconibacterium sp.]
MLDENGSFTTNLDYSHAGFVYVENENKNKHNPPATYVFYAEPGDSIHFESTGKELPWNTTFSGIRTEEQQLLQELRRKIRILESEGRIGGWSNEIFDREISLMRNMGNGRTGVDGDIEIIFSALENAENIISGYQTKLSERSFRFISNEVSMYFYNGIFQHAWISFRQDIPFYYKKELFQNNGKWKEKIDNINIHDFYNDYGLHSRQCIPYYLKYHFAMVQKVHYRYFIGPMTYHNMSEPEMDLQFGRIVLTGSPLYREIAASLTSIPQRRSPYYSQYSSSNYLNDFALRNFDLIKLRCNDLELVEKVTQIVSQHQKLETGKFVPEIEMLDINQNKVAINDFLGEKPTIFYFSQNWINDRYEYDDMAKATPEINFVMVVEGSNFKQWEEYTKSANPTMTHLLFINDSVTFRDIFQAQQVHMVFNKQGEYIGKARNAKQALKLAQDSLIPKKKELNKSQLQMIIIALCVLIILLGLGLIIWKWRVRQRFRREQQQRRLRELELTAIRSQMNPHFLFNSLNSVQNLVQQNKGREAHLYLADFAGLIRKVLQNSEKEEVSLAEELEMTEQYLNLEKLRFDFDFFIGVEQGIDIHNTTVPSMLLQPFAENAVIHGLQNKPENRKLKVEVRKADETIDSTRLEVPNRLAHKATGIIISIEDNGIGREAAAAISKTKNSKGSKLIQERLEILQEKQGEKYRLVITDLTGDETGTRVEIFIPEEN